MCSSFLRLLVLSFQIRDISKFQVEATGKNHSKDLDDADAQTNSTNYIQLLHQYFCKTIFTALKKNVININFVIFRKCNNYYIHIVIHNTQ